jgi:hypothetical protein
MENRKIFSDRINNKKKYLKWKEIGNLLFL